MNSTLNIRKETRHCEHHGAYEALSFIEGRWLGCPTCTKAAEAEREAAERQQARRQRIANAMEHSGIPAKYRAAVVAGLEPTLAPVRNWSGRMLANETEGPLILVGPVGTGKSHAACALLRHFIETTSWHGRYVSAAEYCRRVRATWHDREASESRVIETYARTGLLVLDDLGAGKTHDLELLQELVMQRYEADLTRRLIVCTNLAPKDFDKSFGERIADRLREGATIVAVTGASKRNPTSPAIAATTHALPSSRIKGTP